jgi:hypothetical protein
MIACIGLQDDYFNVLLSILEVETFHAISKMLARDSICYFVVGTTLIGCQTCGASLHISCLECLDE